MLQPCTLDPSRGQGVRGRGARQLPDRIRVEDTIAEHDSSPIDSSTVADERAAERETRWLLERGGGLGV